MGNCADQNFTGCRRGNRECTYPDPATATKGGKGSRKTSTSHDSGSSGDEADALSKEQLATIPDDEDDPLAPLSSGLSSTQQERESSGTPSLTHQSPTPSTDGSASGTLAPVPLVTPAKRPSPKKSGFVPKGGPPVITPDIQFYLDYHRTQISHHHYAIKAGGSDFLRTTFQELARSNEPLLYAVVGFAAYHNTLSKPNGKINEFLRYYNKSVSSLRAALQKGQRHTLPILLTILQLAMTEVSIEASMTFHCTYRMQRNTLVTGSTCSAINEPPSKSSRNCTQHRIWRETRRFEWSSNGMSISTSAPALYQVMAPSLKSSGMKRLIACRCRKWRAIPTSWPVNTQNVSLGVNSWRQRPLYCSRNGRRAL